MMFCVPGVVVRGLDLFITAQRHPLQKSMKRQAHHDLNGKPARRMRVRVNVAVLYAGRKLLQCQLYEKTEQNP